jgi:hypothetical protein
VALTRLSSATRCACSLGACVKESAPVFESRKKTSRIHLPGGISPSDGPAAMLGSGEGVAEERDFERFFCAGEVVAGLDRYTGAGVD